LGELGVGRGFLDRELAPGQDKKREGKKSEGRVVAGGCNRHMEGRL
jgi:hypothetical protein